MTTLIDDAARRLDAFLDQFDDEQERIIRYALDHVVQRIEADRAAMQKACHRGQGDQDE